MSGKTAVFAFGVAVALCALSANIDGVRCDNEARYDNYRWYRFHLQTKEHVTLFRELEERSDSYTFMGHALRPDQKLTVMVAASKIGEITEIVKRYNVSAEVLTTNFQEKIDAQFKTVKPINASASEFGWNNYFHLETLYAWLDSLAAKYPNIVKVLEAGKSFEGRPLKGIKLSHKANNTAVFVEAGIHAREWISPATATFILNELLTSQNATIQDLAQNFDWYFFPVFNPDGYKATFVVDRMWRKTRQPFGVCLGTDLNRNWDSHWNATGSSPDPCRYDFAGASVFSEPESAQLSKFIAEEKKKTFFQAYISLHSYSQLLMFPYGHSKDKVRNYDDLLAIGKKGVEALEKRHGTVFQTGSTYSIIYPSAGASVDWAYEKLNVPLAYTFELRGPPNSTDAFILPADQITPSGEETLDAFTAMLQEGRNRGYFNYTKLYEEANKPSGASDIFGQNLRSQLCFYTCLALVAGQMIKRYFAATAL